VKRTREVKAPRVRNNALNNLSNPAVAQSPAAERSELPGQVGSKGAAVPLLPQARHSSGAPSRRNQPARKCSGMPDSGIRCVSSFEVPPTKNLQMRQLKCTTPIHGRPAVLMNQRISTAPGRYPGPFSGLFDAYADWNAHSSCAEEACAEDETPYDGLGWKRRSAECGDNDMFVAAGQALICDLGLGDCSIPRTEGVRNLRHDLSSAASVWGRARRVRVDS
jgi:hypothetical protein